MSSKIVVVAISIFFVLAISLVAYPSINRSVFDEQNILQNQKSSMVNFQKHINFENLHRVKAESNNFAVFQFGKLAVDKLLAQPGCVGVRVYYYKEQTGRSRYILVGVDSQGKDIQNTFIASPTSLCPPSCTD